MNVARASALLFSSRFASRGVMFAGLAYFANTVGATNMGIFFLFQAIVGSASIPADFGIRGAITKRISESNRSDEQLFAAGGLLKIAAFVLIAAAMFTLRDWIDAYVGSPITLLAIVAIFAREFGLLFQNVLRGELRVGETASLQIARDITWVVASFFFLQFGYEVRALIFGWILGYVAVAVLGYVRISTGMRRPRIDHITSILNYAKYKIILQSGSKLFSWTDVFLIGFILTAADVGAYEIAWRVAGVVIIFSSTIGRTLFPQISQWDSEDRDEDISDIMENGLMASLLIVIPAFFGSTVLAGDILEYIFGAEYRVAWIALIILMAQKVPQVIYNIYGYTLQAMDFPKESAQATALGILANIVLNVALISRFGLVGAAVATTTAFLLNTALHVRFLMGSVELQLPKMQITWILISSMLMSVTIFGATQLLSIDSLFSLLIMIASGGILYWILIGLNTDLRQRVINGVKNAMDTNI